MKAQIPIQIGETNKFDVKNLQEYFTFTDDNRTVQFKKLMDASAFSSVNTLCKSSEAKSISLKFTMSTNIICFGICNENFNSGKIGFQNNYSWGWKCQGNEASHGNPTCHYRLHTLGDMAGKEVILEYDG